MTPEQMQKLQDLESKLVDVVLVEADPDTWPGAGKDLKALDKQERGDRYWSKKNASASMALLMRVYSLADMARRAQAGTPPPAANEGDDADGDLDRELSAVEKDAAARIEKLGLSLVPKRA
jgi:hypothetical protein